MYRQLACLSKVCSNLPSASSSVSCHKTYISTWQVSNSLSHLQAVQQVRSSLVLGRYQPPTGSWCSPSTDRSELLDKSAKQRSEWTKSVITSTIHPSICYSQGAVHVLMSEFLLDCRSSLNISGILTYLCTGSNQSPKQFLCFTWLL